MKIHKKIDIPPRPNWYDRDLPADHVIRINWHNQHNDWWNETCASVLAVFGLPGNRFYYKPYQNYMTFTFKSKKDADLCKVLLSEKITTV